jgi:NitT/TauT family transport system substrate-binding protein
MVILSDTKLKDALNEYPEMIKYLLEISPKFSKLNNPMIRKVVKQWATFNDIAKVGNLSICELLHTINKKIGKEKELFESAPSCIKFLKEDKKGEEILEKPEWLENAKQIILIDVRERDDFFFTEILTNMKKLDDKQILLVINGFYPSPLINIIKEEGNEYYYEKENNNHKLYIKRKVKKGYDDWHKIKESFEEIDLRGWREDPFSTLIKKANDIPQGEGFKIIQYFKPTPLINMIEPLGFETFVDKKSPIEHHIYFYKKITDYKKSKTKSSDGRIPLVIQSATPVVYPIIMRILQSKRLMDKIRLEELKIWDKTEKHLGWIINGNADISFSAVAAVAKIYQKGLDIKMKAVTVWDNFYLLTRDYKADNFGDLIGHKIYLPLIQAAPPYAITKYLLEKLGYNHKDFDFIFGEPFGRPEEIKDMLVSGKIDTALLREPEASFAIHEGNGKIVESFAYKNIWENLYPDKGNLPNAGVLFKGEILRNHPEIVKIFSEETKKAIEWVNNNKDESANTIYDIMGKQPEAAKLFLSRVKLKYVDSNDAIEDITHYINVLNKSGYGKKDFGELKELFI